MRMVFVSAVLSVVALTSPAAADDDRHVSTRLSGYNEVHFIPAPTPALRGAISTQARGRFEASIEGGLIRYELSYRDLEGDVTQAHIHFGQPHTVGGIVVWLCETDAVPHPVVELRGVTPQCPQEGTVRGTISPAQVLTATGQGLDAGEFDELVRAIRAGATYANVHSTLFPPGEIRGQIGDNQDR